MTEESPQQGRVEPPSTTDGAVAPAGEMDDRVVALRESGRSYAAIARQLGIARAVDAQAAFVRALRHQPDAARADLVRRESVRLDDLEKRIREDGGQDPARAERRLVALQKLRRAIG